MRQLKTLTRHN
jgi:hypothetical protein